MGWPHTLRPKGCSAISSGVQATYQAFFGYMFVSPIVGQNLPSALYALIVQKPPVAVHTRNGKNRYRGLAYCASPRPAQRCGACRAGFEWPATPALPTEVVMKIIANGALFIGIRA